MPAKNGLLLLALSALLASACGAPPGEDGPATQPPTAPIAAAAGSPADAIFADDAATTGLVFDHQNGMSGEYQYAEMMGSGAALFDADNDGDLDVYLVQGGPLGAPGDAPAPGDRLFRNDLTVGPDGARELRFTDVTADSGLAAPDYGMGVAAADFDGDGWVDLYVTNLGPNRLFRNLGDSAGDGPRFEDVTDEVTGIRRWSVPATVGDFDRDGRLDLFVGNYVDYTPATNKRCPDELGTPNYCGPLAFAPVADNLLHNRSQAGRIAFEEVSASAGIAGEYGRCLGAAAADIDGDGWLDLYVANDGTANQLWMNRGAAGALRFDNRAVLAGAAVSGQGVPEASMGVSIADFDGDGDEDLFVAHLARETNTLYVNDGSGLFVDGSGTSGLGSPSWQFTSFGSGFFDYDNDGRLDLLTVNGAVKVIKSLALAGDPYPLHQRNLLFHQRGDGSFEEVSAAAGPLFALSEVSRGAAFGDLDNDGDTDVVVTHNHGPARLLRNLVGQDRPWLGLRLVDRRGRRDMIGARGLVVLADGRERWRRVTTTSSYASSSDPRLLFGLGEVPGDPPSEVQVIVEWPDGGREVFDSVAAGVYTTLRQGTGRAAGREGG